MKNRINEFLCSKTPSMTMNNKEKTPNLTSWREAVVVAMVVTTVELVKSWMEAWRKMVATAREANTIRSQRTLPPDFTWKT